jgi:hypothetical protein
VVVSRVPWEALPGETVEDLVAALLLLSRRRGNQITPSRGDRGIDVRETLPGGVRVTQIKRYAGRLSSAQKREIEKSWARFVAEGAPTLSEVESWTLALPWNPSPEALDWFEALTADCGFEVHWLGRTQLDVLAAQRPDIVDYFLGNGADEVKRLMAEAMRGGASTDAAEAGEELLSAVVDRQRHLASALDAVDPFYEYQVEVRSGPMPTEDALVPGTEIDADFITYQQLADDRHMVTRIRPRSPHAVWLRPISRTVHFDVRPGTADHDALERFHRYGATLHRIPATTLKASGPPGTTRTGRGSVSLVPVGASIDGLELRLLQERGDEVLHRIALSNQQVSTGATGEGRRLSATDPSGILTVEALFGFGEDKINLTVSGWPGVPVRTTLPLARLLAAATAGRRFALGIDAGPEVARYNPITGLIGSIEDTLDWLEVLAVIQQHTLQTVAVPPDVPPSQALAAIRAAAMLEGRTLRGRDTPFETQVTEPDTLPVGEVQGAILCNPMVVTLAEHSYVLDRTELVFFRHLRVEPAVPGQPLRAGDTIRLTPREPAAVLAVPHNWRQGDDLPQHALA